MSKTIRDYFFPHLSLQSIFLLTIKNSQHIGSFMVSSTLISPCPVIILCRVLSNKNSLSSCDAQLRIKTIVCIVSRICKMLLTNNSGRGIPHQHLDFYLAIMVLEEALDIPIWMLNVNKKNFINKGIFVLISWERFICATAHMWRSEDSLMLSVLFPPLHEFQRWN